MKKMPCLKEIEFYSSKYKGIPKNLNESNLTSCTFQAHVMTDAERVIYKDFKKKLKEKK